MNKDATIRIVLHSTEVERFTHKTQGTSMSSTTCGIIHTRGKHPNNTFPIVILNKMSTRSVPNPHNVHPHKCRRDRTIHEGRKVCPVPVNTTHGLPLRDDPVSRETTSLSPLV